MAQSEPSRKSLYFDYPEYPFIRPAEFDGESRQHPVVIVGAGPIGMTAALELARHGIRTVVLDDKNTVNEGSRAVCIARHSMECLQQIGLAETFEKSALPWTRGSSYYQDKLVYRLRMPHPESERYYPMYNLQQQYIEKYLIDKADENDLIEMRWQNKVTDIRQDQKGVKLDVETPGGNYTLDSRFILAADGAHSVIRRQLGLRLKGDAYEGRYVIVDIQMKSDYPTERRAFFDPSSNPGLTILIHKQPHDIWRIDYQIDADVDEQEELEESNIRRRISSILEMIKTYDASLEKQVAAAEKLDDVRIKLDGRLAIARQEREELAFLLQLAKSKEMSTQAMRSLDSLMGEGDREVAQAAENIRRRLDHADAAWEVQTSSLDQQMDDAMYSLEVEAELAARMDRLGI